MTVVAEPTVLAAALTVLGLDFLKSKFNLVADFYLDFLISKVDL